MIITTLFLKTYIGVVFIMYAGTVWLYLSENEQERETTQNHKKSLQKLHSVLTE